MLLSGIDTIEGAILMFKKSITKLEKGIAQCQASVSAKQDSISSLEGDIAGLNAASREGEEDHRDKCGCGNVVISKQDKFCVNCGKSLEPLRKTLSDGS